MSNTPLVHDKLYGNLLQQKIIIIIYCHARNANHAPEVTTKDTSTQHALNTFKLQSEGPLTLNRKVKDFLA